MSEGPLFDPRDFIMPLAPPIKMKSDAKLLEALALLERGERQQAHAIVQQHDTRHAAWLHGIVHVLEGDLDNARYWYERAKRTFSPDAKSELAAARRTLDAP